MRAAVKNIEKVFQAIIVHVQFRFFKIFVRHPSDRGDRPVENMVYEHDKLIFN